MKISRRSQVTAFIIIAIVIVIVFVGLMFIVITTKEHRLRVTKDQLRILLTKDSKYHTYITSCLDQLTKEALWKLGYQGGVIYTTQADNTKQFFLDQQGKYYIPYKFIDHAGNEVSYNVSYGILQPRISTTLTNHLPPPFYPYPGRLISTPQEYNPSYSYTLGNFPQPGPFTPLCNSLGLNTPFIPNASFSCGSYETSYDTMNEWDKNSMQEYLENYIQSHITDCIKLEDLPELVDWNITNGNASVILAFSDDFVYSFLNYSLYLQRGPQQESLRLETFSVKEPVRLRQIHELFNTLIKEDSNNIFFDVLRDTSTLVSCTNITTTQCLKPNMSLTKYRDVCIVCPAGQGDYDDILVLEDSKSVIDGAPYRFQIAIQNRIPTLEYLDSNVSFLLPDGRKAFLVFPGEMLHIDTVAYDPDEDDHGAEGFMQESYNYTGWRETYLETFDVPRWQRECSEPAQCYPRIRDFITTILLPPHKMPHNFTNSPLFITTGRSAAFMINGSDYGLHNVTINIFDNQRLRDWQDIYIYVPPPGEIVSYHIYSDIPQHITSMEDELILQASLYPEQIEKGQIFKWKVDSPDPNYNTNTPKLVVGIGGNINRLSIGEHTINLGVYEQSGTPPRETIVPPLISPNKKIFVAQCLPHRSVVPAYPFNNFVLEPYKETNNFLVNHTCCIGNPGENPNGWSLASADTVCYNKTFVGRYDEINQAISGPTTTPSSDPNKLYKRTVAFKCGIGTKSYECTTPIEDKIEEIS